ncbi:unnamed protein product [Prunus armeniaca]|uniref:Uncharacterized protein n=1 Tax=Prunus armeniaca TaxID=36596 RepID=A0A6J5X6I0_PRUAR|nr:unnamed protein product [Prunus armeniaca]
MEGDKGKCSKVYGESTSVVINVEELKRNIEAKFRVHSPSLHSCCIFKVPEAIRRHNEQVYEPNIVSIGPFHHGKEKFQFFENVKHWYFTCLISSSENVSLDSLIEGIMELVKSAQECYVAYRWMLENQLPWSVLEYLYNHTPNSPSLCGASLISLVINFFSQSEADEQMLNPRFNSPRLILHILDLVRVVILSEFKETSSEEEGKKKYGSNLSHRMPNATSPSEAGIRLYDDTTVMEYYYTGLSDDVNYYYKTKWHRFMEILRHDYFSTPWRIISFIAAFILLVLTLVQTLYTVRWP